LEALRVERSEFEGALTRDLHPASRVTDYYGLVEQVGIIYPLCEAGARHVPVWADVLVRDPYTLRALENEPGQIQSMNPLAYGAPYHSVLSEDMGRIIPGDCPCGRAGKRFELLGRMPQAELRGCANV
jgi:phenylacetate-coenzyme A ligase PaaK-like adenylate-forming protein